MLHLNELYLRYPKNEDRVKNRESLLELLQGNIKRMSIETLKASLEQVGIPFGIIKSVGQAFSHPQAKANGMTRAIRHEKLNLDIQMVGPAVKYSETPACIRTAPPLLGEHTEQVLKEFLNYDSLRLKDLYRRGVI